MKVKTMPVLPFVILAAASRAQSSADSKTEEVTEAAFREQVTFWLKEDGRQSGVVVCLSVERVGETRSVTQEYVRRLADPAVRRAIDCETREAGPVERATGRPAVMVTVGAITWPAPDEARVTVRYSRRLHSGSLQYHIVKEQTRWICLGPMVKLSPSAWSWLHSVGGRRNAPDSEAWFHVGWDALAVHLDVSPPGRESWRASFEWSTITRVCSQLEGMWASDGIYVFTAQRPESYVIPIEADGGQSFWDELVSRELFDPDLAIKAVGASEGLYCWPGGETKGGGSGRP